MQRLAIWLERGGSRRLALLHPPAGGRARAALLLLPPFAEELNKTRRACARAAAAFAEAGYAVLQFDPLGCGDSAGDFGDAGWADWEADTALAAQALRERHPGAPLLAWGLRAGCLLGQGLNWAGQLWWQPSPQGKAVLQQFLRLRTAAELGADEGTRTGMAELKAQLAAGQAVEVAGYLLAPALAQGLEQAQLSAPAVPTLWLEAGSQQPAALLPGSQRLLEAWAGPQRQLQALALNDNAPWAATELEDCPQLTAASLDWLNARFQAGAAPQGGR